MSTAEEALPYSAGSDAALLPPRSVFSLSSSEELDAAVAIAASNWAQRAPWKLLAFFCAILFLVWFDNGLFASNGVTGCSKNCENPVGFRTAQGDFDLSKLQLGVLAAFFMVGLMIASVLLTQLTHFITPFRLIVYFKRNPFASTNIITLVKNLSYSPGVGMGIWVIAAAGGGASLGFWSLLAARTFVGAGEASIITLSAPFVDDVAPEGSVSLWFGILSSAPPIGVALGYIFGGLAEAISWRWLFVIEASLGIPIVFIALFAPDVDLRQGLENEREVLVKQSRWETLLAGFRAFWEDIRILHRHPVFLLNTFAFAPIQAAVGAFSFWGPKVGVELFHLDSDFANLSLGALTIACALSGILGGGAVLDLVGASIQNALAMQLAASLTGLVFCVIAVTVIGNTFGAFCALFGIGLFGLFIATAPLYAVGMWSIPLAQRPVGQAYLVVIMHLLGDVPSPPVVGAIQGWVSNWHISLLVISSYLIVSVLLFTWSLVASKKAPDYRGQELSH